MKMAWLMQTGRIMGIGMERMEGIRVVLGVAASGRTGTKDGSLIGISGPGGSRMGLERGLDSMHQVGPLRAIVGVRNRTTALTPREDPTGDARTGVLEDG